MSIARDQIQKGLKACPLCGSKKRVVTGGLPFGDLLSAQCKKCGWYYTPRKRKEEAA